MTEKDESDKHEEPVVRDKRRIDPETGKIRRPEGESGADAAASAPGAGPAAEGHPDEQVVDTGEGSDGEDAATSLTEEDLAFLAGQGGQGGEPGRAGDAGGASDAETLAAERLADLQRVTAEYANYRKRTEANREVERERAIGNAVAVLLPVLDDLDRAEKHGDLEGEGAFATIAAKLRGAAEKLGLQKFGAPGEPFDHNVHDALFQQPSAEVTSDTVAEVVETGYTLGSTLVRAAKVVVATPQ